MAYAMISFVMEKLNSIRSAEFRQMSEVEQELEELSKNLGGIQAVVEDAELRQLTTQRVRLWLDLVKDATYDLEDVLDKWNTATATYHGVRSFDPSQNSFENDFILEIRELNERLDELAMIKQDFGFKVNVMNNTSQWHQERTEISIDMYEKIYGLENEMRSLLKMLLSDSSRDEERKVLRIIAILGVEGTDKSTLAHMAYNNDKVKRNYDLRIWVSVNGDFDDRSIAKSITEALGGSASDSLSTNLQFISKSIVGKKFILVLKDVRLEKYDKCEQLFLCLKNGLFGSKILVITQNESVARIMGSTDIITIKKMSEENCWLLFKQIAFLGRSCEECERLKEIGTKIVQKIIRKCNGLSLALKIIGSILCHKKTEEEWKSILDSQMWELEEIYKQHFVSLFFMYNDLSFTIKRCFLCCAIFPKDYRISKDELIKLWMAHDYLERTEDEQMEAIGQKYFGLLVSRFLFQETEFEMDDNGSILRCKLHDTVYDFLQYLSMNECRSIEVKGDVEELRVQKFRHSFLVLNKGVSFPVSVSNIKNLRSLLIQYGVTNCLSVSEVLPELISQSTSLRALDMSGHSWYENLIIKIPREIGTLVFLRYLNLSSLKIAELPEDLCELYNLQTLELNWCTNLKRLPLEMGNLINLRHMLYVGTSLDYMPKGIERLTCLRTLSEFVVSSDGTAGTLECLKNLNKLQGSLSIRRLGNVTNVNEVVEAEIESKLNLFGLSLTFENDAEEGRMKKDEDVPEAKPTEEERAKEDEEILKAMKPPKNLERLEIRNYRGSIMLPNWLMSLSKLKILSLHGCINCEQLPCLGKLPSLESLSIYSMGSVKRVGNEFLGIQSNDGASSSSSVTPFSKLKSLKFVNMEEWEDWQCEIKIMPLLQFLSLVYCPKLKALPDHILQAGMLEELNINWCPLLKKCYNKKTGGQDWQNISHIPKIMINFAYVRSNQED